jgi:hypothetical protein
MELEIGAGILRHFEVPAAPMMDSRPGGASREVVFGILRFEVKVDADSPMAPLVPMTKALTHLGLRRELDVSDAEVQHQFLNGNSGAECGRLQKCGQVQILAANFDLNGPKLLLVLFNFNDDNHHDLRLGMDLDSSTVFEIAATGSRLPGPHQKRLLRQSNTVARIIRA